jgi:hypothetical protein
VSYGPADNNDLVTRGSDLFVGRANELGQLAAFAREHRAGLVLVAGEAGVGKTRLVAEALRASATEAVWGACWQGDGAPAFWPWTQVIQACVASDSGAAWQAGADWSVDEVTALLPSAGRPEPTVDSSRFRLFEAVTRLVHTVGARDGLTVVFDDLQWADEASVRLLGFAVRALHDEPVAFVGTYRDDEVGPAHPLSTMLAEMAGRVRHLRLEGLDTDDLERYARAQLDGEALVVPDLQRLTGGNPFFAREVLALVRGRGNVPGHLQVPPGVRAVIQQRLARLSSECDDALRLAAVLGTAFTLEHLATAIGASAADVLGVLGEAVEAQMVIVDRGTAGDLRFAHDLLRETIYESMAPIQRVALHARVADALEPRLGGRGTSPATIAHHLVRAAPLVGYGRAADAAMRAGHDALDMLANEEAGEWFARAIGLVRSDTGDETALIAPLLALGDALLRSSELPRARDAFVEAAAIARRHGRAPDLAVAALGLGAGLGGFEVSLFDHAQIELLEDALTAVGAADSARRALLLARLSIALSFVAEDRRLDLSTEAVAMARRLDDRSVLGYALAAHCDATAGPVHSEARRDAAAEVVAIGRALGDRRLELLGRRLRIVALLELAEIGEADAEIRAFSVSSEAIREPLYRWYAPLWRGMRALMAGNAEESAACCDEAAALGAMADSANATMLTLTQRWVRLRVEGRLAEAAAMMETDGLAAFGDLAGTYATAALGYLWAGRLDDASARLRAFVADLGQVPRDAEWLPTMAQLASLATALGDRQSAAALDPIMAPFDDRVVVEGIGAAVCGTLGSFRAPLLALLGRLEESRAIAHAADAAASRMGLVTMLATSMTAAQPSGRERVGSATCGAGIWTLAYEGASAAVPDSKGLRDLAILLVAPGRAFHVSELVDKDALGRPAVLSRGDVILDRRAIADFRRRLAELEDEIADAQDGHDEGRAGKLTVDREFLLAELSRAAGLGGRSRRAGDDVDRARKAVRARVRDAIGRIEAAHPELGRHLAHAVQTGTFCTYEPEVPVRWTIRA